MIQLEDSSRVQPAYYSTGIIDVEPEPHKSADRSPLDTRVKPGFKR